MEFDFSVSQHLYFGPGKLSWLPEMDRASGCRLLMDLLDEWTKRQGKIKM